MIFQQNSHVKCICNLYGLAIKLSLGLIQLSIRDSNVERGTLTVRHLLSRHPFFSSNDPALDGDRKRLADQ